MCKNKASCYNPNAESEIIKEAIMKKILLVIFILILTATNVFAEDFSEDTQENKNPIIERILKHLQDVEDSPSVVPPRIQEVESIPSENTLEDTQEVEDIPSEKALDKTEENNDTLSKEPPNDSQNSESILADKVAQINLIQDDEQKIKEWARLNSDKYYVIINKKECSAIVYDREGNEIQEFEIGVGREIGDDFNDTSGVTGKAKNTTPAGEFILIPNIFNKSAYGDITLSLGAAANKAKRSKKMVALHKVPKFREQERLKKFYDGNLANNRMSHGCINFTEKDFKELTKYIHGGFKAYVLPEERDNKLMLEKNDKGDYVLSQTKY